MSILKFAKLSRVSDQELENLFLTGKDPELKELVRQEMRCRTIREKHFQNRDNFRGFREYIFQLKDNHELFTPMEIVHKMYQENPTWVWGQIQEYRVRYEKGNDCDEISQDEIDKAFKRAENRIVSYRYNFHKSWKENPVFIDDVKKFPAWMYKLCLKRDWWRGREDEYRAAEAARSAWEKDFFTNQLEHIQIQTFKESGKVVSFLKFTIQVIKMFEKVHSIFSEKITIFKSKTSKKKGVEDKET